MESCAECGNGSVREVHTPEEIRVGEVTFRVDVGSIHCPECGHVEPDAKARRRAQLLAAKFLADRGARTAEAFRFMRRVVGLSGAELARLIGVEPETVSRWETGKREITRCAVAILGAIVVDKVKKQGSTLDRLRALQRGDGVTDRAAWVDLGAVPRST